MRLQWRINVTNYMSVVGGKNVVNQCLEFGDGYMISTTKLVLMLFHSAIHGADPQCES